jgi:hypothetical protein
MSGYNEEAYREARESAIALACPFERALLSRCVNCFKARRLLLAEREAISCTEQPASDRCLAFHRAVHRNARFALHMDPGQPWPFGKEIRAQCGGVLGLRAVLAEAGDAVGDTPPADVALLIEQGIERFLDIDSFPYSEIMRGVVHYEPRKRR